MTPILLALLVATLVPFFVSGWRANVAALSLQGLLMGWLALSRGAEPAAEALLPALDFLLLRGGLAPILLARAMGAQDSARGDAVPPNMLSWAFVAALVAVAFRFAATLAPQGGEAQSVVAVAAAGLLLGFFTLATQTGVFSQAAAALRIENAVALFELAQDVRWAPAAVEWVLVAVFALTALMYAAWVRKLTASPGAEPFPSGAALEEPAL